MPCVVIEKDDILSYEIDEKVRKLNVLKAIAMVAEHLKPAGRHERKCTEYKSDDKSERPLTDAEIDQMQANADARTPKHNVNEMRYDARARAFHFLRLDGPQVAIPIAMLREFDEAIDRQLCEVKLAAAGSAIEHRGLDINMSVHGMIRDAFGFVDIQQKRAGKAKSPAKTAAARVNGAKGGRPRESGPILA